MTFEQRMAELGVDLSDLPDASINITKGHRLIDAAEAARRYSSYYSEYAYILHLTDVIDRMETRLVNVTGELNYIKDTFKDCATCTVGSIPHSDKCDACDENFSNYEFAGVLEDWRADDDSTV